VPLAEAFKTVNLQLIQLQTLRDILLQ